MEIFRKSALNRLSSLEQLDKMIVVTSPMTLLMVLGGFIVTISTLLWCAFGKIPVYVQTTGIILTDENSGMTEAVCYVPAAMGKSIRKDMDVVIFPGILGGYDYNHISAKVTDVDSYVTKKDDIVSRVKDELLAESFVSDGPVIEVVCDVAKNEDAEYDFELTDSRGQKVVLDEGTMFIGRIIIDKKSPISMIFPNR